MSVLTQRFCYKQLYKSLYNQEEAREYCPPFYYPII